MGLFSCRNSRIPLLFAWLFVVAFLADSANLDDLIPGTIVLHSDEDNSLQSDSGLLENIPLNEPVQSHALPARHSAKNERQAKGPVRIIYDQDSDSLAAQPTLPSESCVVLPSEIRVCVESAQTIRTLYLLHCSLLI